VDYGGFWGILVDCGRFWWIFQWISVDFGLPGHPDLKIGTPPKKSTLFTWKAIWWILLEFVVDFSGL
jgi:hypothetical protein